MKIGIIGAGQIGGTLTRRWLCTITRSCTKSQEAAQKPKNPDDLFARDSSLAARFITVSQTG
jgi:predicted dinucleotide-binding enzyme